MTETPQELRSRTMRAVKGENTTPEMRIRHLIHSMGYRYRLHRKDLPGKPDLVFLSRRKIIFIHGCFWHGHDCRRGARMPKANRDYWEQKISRNRARDANHRTALQQAGWRVLIIWECQLKEMAALRNEIACFLESHGDDFQVGLTQRDST